MLNVCVYMCVHENMTNYHRVCACLYHVLAFHAHMYTSNVELNFKRTACVYFPRNTADKGLYWCLLSLVVTTVQPVYFVDRYCHWFCETKLCVCMCVIRYIGVTGYKRLWLGTDL